MLFIIFTWGHFMPCLHVMIVHLQFPSALCIAHSGILCIRTTGEHVLRALRVPMMSAWKKWSFSSFRMWRIPILVSYIPGATVNCQASVRQLDWTSALNDPPLNMSVSIAVWPVDVNRTQLAGENSNGTNNVCARKRIVHLLVALIRSCSVYTLYKKHVTCS